LKECLVQKGNQKIEKIKIYLIHKLINEPQEIEFIGKCQKPEKSIFTLFDAFVFVF